MSSAAVNAPPPREEGLGVGGSVHHQARAERLAVAPGNRQTPTPDPSPLGGGE